MFILDAISSIGKHLIKLIEKFNNYNVDLNQFKTFSVFQFFIVKLTENDVRLIYI